MRAGLLPNLLTALALMAIGAALRSCVPAPDPVVQLVPDTATAAALRAELDEARRHLMLARGEATGLRGVVAGLSAKVRGLEERKPQRITVYDTTFSIERDTVFLRAQINGAGQLAIVRALPDTAGLHRAEKQHGIRVGDCDDGLDITTAGVVCNTARFGHLTLIARGIIGADAGWPADSVAWRAEAGLHWTPSFRSSTAAELVATSTQRIEARLSTGVRLW